MPLASFCRWADGFESYLVENPEDRFTRDEAHIMQYLQCFYSVFDFISVLKDQVFIQI